MNSLDPRVRLKTVEERDKEKQKEEELRTKVLEAIDELGKEKETNRQCPCCKGKIIVASIEVRRNFSPFAKSLLPKFGENWRALPSYRLKEILAAQKERYSSLIYCGKCKISFQNLPK